MGNKSITFEKLEGNKHVLIIGALGSGKSTLMSILHNDKQDELEFEASNSLTGCT